MNTHTEMHTHTRTHTHTHTNAHKYTHRLVQQQLTGHTYLMQFEGHPHCRDDDIIHGLNDVKEPRVPLMRSGIPHKHLVQAKHEVRGTAAHEGTATNALWYATKTLHPYTSTAATASLPHTHRIPSVAALGDL